jgi:Ser/Thr protein kinase RdoA (MazF antagonist)
MTSRVGIRPLPWEDGQVGQVLGTLDRLADVLTPAPITAPAIGQYLGADFTGRRILTQTPGDERLDPWSRARLADLAAVEATWAAHAAGTTLLHADIRADNVLLTGSGGTRPRSPGSPSRAVVVL